MNEKPGVMLYFDLLPLMDRLSNEDKGNLLHAILHYGKYGEMINLTDKVMLIWPLVQMRLDTDEKHYCDRVIRGKYAAHVRWSREKGEEPMPYDQWLSSKKYRELDVEELLEETRILGMKMQKHALAY